MMSVKAVVLLAVVLATAHASSTFVWVTSEGEASWTLDSFPLNTTKISTGHYCIFGRSTNTMGVFNYAALTATLQTGGAAIPSPGFVVANTGWGDACNPYDGIAIYTYNILGQLEDRYFSAVLTWDEESAAKAPKLMLRK